MMKLEKMRESSLNLLLIFLQNINVVLVGTVATYV